jgi:hypothetical protein
MFSQQLSFFFNAFIVDQLHQLYKIFAGASTTPDPSVCIVYFKSFALLVKITCRNYLCLASLNA